MPGASMPTPMHLALALLVACGGGEPPAPAADSPAPAPSGPRSGPSAVLTPVTVDPSIRPDVDGEIARIDMTQPGARPAPGVWTLTEHTLVENTCDMDPRQAEDGPCTMGCGPSTIAPVEPGVFTLEAPALGYAGTCVLLDGGARYTCAGGTSMVTAESELAATLVEGGVADGAWTVVMTADGPGAGCRMSGTFKASPPAG